jgi:hypothetical protein
LQFIDYMISTTLAQLVNGARLAVGSVDNHCEVEPDSFLAALRANLLQSRLAWQSF